MPREGIDYPGWWNRAACSIRCELSKLWSAVGAKVAKLNTVEPDGDGKINIVSDSATLSVTDDQGNNAVRLSLDPAVVTPPVQSVNGTTGTVVLDGSDITGSTTVYDGTSTFNSSSSINYLIRVNALGAKAGDDTLRTRMTAAETAISTEASDRATADNALSAQIATKASAGDTVLKNPSAAQTIYGYDLGIDENLDVNGDADVGGDLDVSGSATASALSVSGTAALTTMTTSGTATFSGTTIVPTVATGTADTQAANGTKVKNELDNYSPMVRTTGTQTTIAGLKGFINLAYKLGQQKISTTVGMRICNIYAQDGSYVISAMYGTRFGSGLANITVVISSGAISAVSATHLYTGSNQQVKFGAYLNDGYIVLYIRGNQANMNAGVAILSIGYGAGNAITSNFEDYSDAFILANYTCVEES